MTQNSDMIGIDRQKAYWVDQLSGAPPPPALPWDRERPPVSSFLRETVSSRMNPPTVSDLYRLAAGSDTMPQVVLVAALKALLFRYTGQSDLTVATLLGSGLPAGVTELVALRSRVAGLEPVRNLVLREAASVREAQAHLGVPFEAVLRALWNGADARVEEVFNVVLLFQQGNGCVPDSSAIIEPAFASHLMSCPLILRIAELEERLDLQCDFDSELFEPGTVRRFVEHFQTVLGRLLSDPDTPVDRLALLTPAEQRQLLVDWNATETRVPPVGSIHQLIEIQARQTPDAVAAIGRDKQLTFAELNARANQVAGYLSKFGVGPEVIVGICVERSLEMLVGLLGILKSGGAYLPLDPAYPAERLAFMLADAQAKVVLTQAHLAGGLPPGAGPCIRLDADWPSIGSQPASDIDRGAGPRSLAYVIYTSGSTGKPKGVMVEHGNVLNFFAGMDDRIQRPPGSTWLAVTSPSFDISVLELFWTLARGLKVVIYAGDESPNRVIGSRMSSARRPLEFSLFYFSSDQTDGPGGAYRLLVQGARFADEHGFVAVWTPERHFHDFGGLYPNPSVTSAAIAMVTKRVQIRSGSVVAPLHSPIRIAEEWSVVDNLSQGRAAISFASGWMPEDFAVRPDAYRTRKETMFHHIDVVRRLWRGERVPMPGPFGEEIPVKIFPRPVQKELPLWLTAAGNPETFVAAGRLGLNLLTHLLGQSLEEVSQKVVLYREAWKTAGHPGRGHVTLMLHTFMGESLEFVKAMVREPLIEYLRKSADLIKGYAWAFSAFKHRSESQEHADFSALPKEEMDALLEHAFERYFETSGLFGTPESCARTLERLMANDVDEAACLIDFGVNAEVVLQNLPHLDRLRQAAARMSGETAQDFSIPALIQRHQVTHFQCTPSMASMLLLNERTPAAFGRLQHLLIGGEAFPPALARQLRKIVPGAILNMYGPTETTVWSSSYQLPADPARILVGRPIANTAMYIVDSNRLPVPVGVTGELLIGGAGVARGYLGRPELTAERFIPNPVDNSSSGRVYRTGDLARFRPDGNIELLGRVDHQVKIRGHRVELGEIEASLAEHPDVRESVVISSLVPGGDRQLVAYVIPRETKSPTRRELRDYLRSRVPDYMVPAQVVFLKAFPQTPNKKVDRSALPPPETGRQPEDEFEAPAEGVEEALAGLWKELLGVSRVGRRDNFFEAGGHSLLAMQLVGKVRDRFGVALPLRNLFERPTVAGLAEIIDALSWSTAADAPAPPMGSREEVML